MAGAAPIPLRGFGATLAFIWGRDMSHGFLLILALACALSPPAAFGQGRQYPPPGILGADDRAPLDSTAWPWQAIGRLNQPHGGYCTATLVAPDAVLTAGHCLTDKRGGQKLTAQDLVFVADLRRDDDLGYARGRAIGHAPPPPLAGRPRTLDDIAEDWALVYLEHPLPIRPVPALPLTAADASPPPRLQRAGYGQDRPNLLSLHDGCEVLERLYQDRVLVSDCDGTHGDSGSPLLARRGQDAWIVGILSAVGAGRGGPGNYAVHAAVFWRALPPPAGPGAPVPE